MNNVKEKLSVLIVDDEAVIRNGMGRALQGTNAETQTAASGEEALELLDSHAFDVVFLDIRMPDMDGITLLKKVRAKHPFTQIVMITGYPTIDTAVQCVKLGASDYLVKPIRIADFKDALKGLEPGGNRPETHGKDEEGLKIDSEKNIIIGRSPAMKQIFRKIRKVAPTDSTVLITGESGTGKELVARAIHFNGTRRDKAFVAVDCSALVETLLESELFGHVKGSFTGAIQTKHGYFELANHGTFFFDEISNLSLNTQAKLLRVVQEREFMKVGDQKKIKLDIRIISASNTNLRETANEGKFREDLFYRLSVVPIHLPPLRQRKEDIPLFVTHFLDKFSRKIKRAVPHVSEEAMDALKEYVWPGNVRELEHTIERILILEDTDVIRPSDLPSSISRKGGEFQTLSEVPVSLEELEKRYIRFVLRRTKGKKTEAARILGINRKTLGLKVKKYEIY
ncbi:MAG: sigma-54-dependent Fis family transcriptional regulator [Deltaproteobacteria bacterium]|nr:sigma-54-dependent Fis family transcriptional regulator [Deltaproteobacteria bacterium]MBW1815740.1 sigma-54-dependent Fis family transcriptional regulator [Deltaproteobacteria bacterium]